MTVTTHTGPVFSAAGHCFTWVDVIGAARARGDWAALQHQQLRLLARERDLAAAGGLPGTVQVRAAANEFRYQHNLLSADELEEWLARNDVTLDEWTGEMRRSLLEPADHESRATLQAVERACWVHAVCSGKLTDFARTLAEEVAAHLSEHSLAPTSDELAALPQQRERFCLAHSGDSALAAEIDNNKFGWTRMDLRSLVHSDEMVVREAALCVRLDGRELADIANAAGARLQETSLLLDDATPALRTRLLTANPGELLGPLKTGADHELVLVVHRVPPTFADPAVRRRAAQTVVERALAAEVNRHVNWHEQL